MSTRLSKKEQEKKVWLKFAIAAFHSYTSNVNAFRWKNGGDNEERSQTSSAAADLLTKEYMNRYGEDE